MLSDREYTDDSSSDELIEINYIENFILNEQDNIINFYYELKDNLFSYYFNDTMTYDDLIEFIVNNKFLQNHTCSDSIYTYKHEFLSEYNDELFAFLRIINNFVKNYNLKITEKNVFEFCYKFTSIKNPIKLM